MATEGQIAALGKWLKVAVKEDIQFDMASGALARLHDASEKYNENKSMNKGIVSQTKKELINELRQAGYIIGDEDQTELKEEESLEFKTLNGAIKEQEEEPAGLPKHEQEIIDDVVTKLSACTRAAKAAVEQDYKDLELTDGEKARVRHAIAATLLIQASRGGL